MNTRCHFIHRPPDSCVCKYCGFVSAHDDCSRIVRRCPARDSGPPPSLGKKVVAWKGAVRRWKEAGSPSRSDAEVARLLTVCQRCEHFNKRGSCSVCGCRVSASRYALVNKLRMATEECPKGKWGKRLAFVYPYYHANAQGNELLYSVRSVAKHYIGEADIWIVGDRPSWWLRDDRFIDAPIVEGGARIDRAHKLQCIVDHEEIPDEFVWMQDDIYFTAPMSYSFLSTHWVRAKAPTPEFLQTWEPTGGYFIQKKRTWEKLLENGKTIEDYASHTPQIYEREKLRQLIKKYDLLHEPYVDDLLYYNEYHIGEAPPIGTQAYRVNAIPTQEQYDKRMAIAKLHNHVNESYHGIVEQGLAKRFKEACVWEKPGDSTLVGASWMLRNEAAAILDIIPEDGKVLEIGTLNGLTVARWAKARPGATFYSVDPLRWWRAGLKWYDNRQYNNRLITGTIDDLADLGVQTVFDVVVVDGDHTYAMAHNDLVKAVGMLSPRGKIAVHDYAKAKGKLFQPEVGPAVDAFCVEYGYKVDRVVGTVAFLEQVDANNLEDVFTNIYKANGWKSQETKSGRGSTLEATALAREIIPEVIKAYDVTSVLDIPCGDYHWFQHIDIGDVGYIGGDIVQPLIDANKAEHPGVDFRHMDLLKDNLPAVDLICCRDCLVHMSPEQIKQAAVNIKRSGSRFLLATTFPGNTNKAIKAGQWCPCDLQAEPHNWPPPIEIYSEGFKGKQKNKGLGLWRIKDLPVGE